MIYVLKNLSFIWKGWRGIRTQAASLEGKALDHYTNGECVAIEKNFILDKLHGSHGVQSGYINWLYCLSMSQI